MNDELLIDELDAFVPRKIRVNLIECGAKPFAQILREGHAVRGQAHNLAVARQITAELLVGDLVHPIVMKRSLPST